MLDTLDELNIPTNFSVPEYSLLLWEHITDDTLEDRHQNSMLITEQINTIKSRSLFGVSKVSQSSNQKVLTKKPLTN